MYFKYDIKIGLKKSLPWLSAVSAAALISCLSLFISVRGGYDSGLEKGYDINLSDYFLYLFKAELPVELQGDGQFKLPILWLLMNVIICFIAGKYPYSEIHNNHGISVLIKGKSRTKWFLSKWLWSVSAEVLCYAVILLTIILFCVFTQSPLSFDARSSESEILLSPIKEAAAFEILQLYLLPIITSITLITIQLAVSLLFGSLVGFIISCVICVSSAYTMLPVLTGNCSMMIRSSLFLENGIDFRQAIIYCGVETLVFLAIGLLRFKHYDLLAKR